MQQQQQQRDLYTVQDQGCVLRAAGGETAIAASCQLWLCGVEQGA
jgi:hypothetical protein